MTKSEMRAAMLVQQGDYRLAKDGECLTTLLGSCLGIVFYDRELKIGGMAHARFPRDTGSRNLPASNFVDGAIDILCARFMNEGSRLEKVEISLYGAAALMPERTDKKDGIGESNVKAAISVLEHRGLRPLAVKTGGNRGVRIGLDTANGIVTVEELQGLSGR